MPGGYDGSMDYITPAAPLIKTVGYLENGLMNSEKAKLKSYWAQTSTKREEYETISWQLQNTPNLKPASFLQMLI